MLVPVDCLKPGDKFIDLDGDPYRDVNFVVLSRDFEGKVVVEDEFGYQFHFNPNKIVRILP